MLAAGGLALPFATARANRIVPGEARFLFDALPMATAFLLVAVVTAGLLVGLFQGAA